MVCSSTSNSFGLSRYLGRPQLVQKKNANEYLGPLLLREDCMSLFLKIGKKLLYEWGFQKKTTEQ